MHQLNITPIMSTLPRTAQLGERIKRERPGSPPWAASLYAYPCLSRAISFWRLSTRQRMARAWAWLARGLANGGGEASQCPPAPVRDSTGRLERFECFADGGVHSPAEVGVAANEDLGVVQHAHGHGFTGVELWAEGFELAGVPESGDALDG